MREARMMPAAGVLFGLLVAMGGSSCGDRGESRQDDAVTDAGTDSLARADVEAGTDLSVELDSSTEAADAKDEMDAEADAVQASLEVTAEKTYVNAGSDAFTVTAALLHSRDAIAWSLMPPDVGSLSAATGEAVQYTPPASIASLTEVTVVASAAGLQASVVIEVDVALATTGLPLLPGRFVALSRISEFLLLGNDYDGSGANQFVIDPYELFGKVDDQPVSLPEGIAPPVQEILDAQTCPGLAEGNRRVAASGNLDDDFGDETVVITWDADDTAGTVTLIDAVQADSVPELEDLTLPWDLTVQAGIANVDYDVEVADLDGDGYSEIAIVGTVLDSSILVHWSGWLWVFDDARSEFALLRKTELKGVYGEGYLGTMHLGLMKARLAVGSMTADGSIQIVAAWYDTTHGPKTAQWGHLYLTVFNAADGTVIGDEVRPALLVGWFPSVEIAQWDTSYDRFDVTILDTDGDAAGELLFAAWASMHQPSGPYGDSDFQRVDTLLLDDLDKSLLYIANPSTDWSEISPADTRPSHLLRPIDYDLDGVDEFLLFPSLYSFDSKWLKLLKSFDGIVTAADMAVGDLNGDRRPDPIFLQGDGTVASWLYLDVLDHVEPDGTKVYSPVPAWTPFTSGGATNATASALLVPVNVDSDSLIVEYKGDPALLVNYDGDTEEPPPGPAHSIYYRDDKIIALLAAPPVRDGIGQDLDDCSTTFGTGESTSFTTGSEFSVRAGLLFGFEYAVSSGLFADVELFRIEAEVTHQVEYTHSTTWTDVVEKTIEYSAPAGMDMVVFSATPYDRYVYNIVSSPDPGLAGTEMTVDVPQKPAVLFMSRDYFNAQHPGGLQITHDLLPDTPFDLGSYPAVETMISASAVDIGSAAEAATSITLLDKMGPVVVSESGTVTQTVGFAEETSVGENVTFACDINAKVVIGGFSAGLNTGFSIGGFEEVTTSKTTSFSGAVAGIPAEFYAENKYSWGMYIYRQKLKDDAGAVMQDFFVVNYWVE